MAVTSLPGALSFHFPLLRPPAQEWSIDNYNSNSNSNSPLSATSSMITSCSLPSSPPMAHMGLSHIELTSTSRSVELLCENHMSLLSTSLNASSQGTHHNAGGMRAGALVSSSRISSSLPLFASSGRLLRQQARVALSQRNWQRVHSVRVSSLKDSQREITHEVEGHSTPLELGSPPSTVDTQERGSDGGESSEEQRDGEDLHSAENGRDSATNELLVRREEEEGVSLKEEVKEEEEDMSGAVKGTILATLFLLGVVGGFGALGFYYKEQINDLLTQFSDFLEGYGPAGYGLFVLAYAGLEVLAIPAVPLTMSAGLLFGTLYGTVLVSIAGTLAATAAFLIARYLARDRILKLAQNNKKFLAIDKAIGEDGFRVVTLLRLSPLLPFSLGNYLYGLTSVKMGPYVLGSWLGMLPGTWAYVSAGAIGRAFIKQESEAVFPEGPEQYWTLGIGLVATVFAASYVTRLAKGAMKDIEEAD